jgi:hypothetical protein
MSLHRRDARRDDGEVDIIAALRAAGASVTQISGKGVPDLLVGFRGATYLCEVKAPVGPRGGASRSGQKLAASQKKFKAEWRGSPVHVVRSVEAALNVIGVLVMVGATP